MLLKKKKSLAGWIAESWDLKWGREGYVLPWDTIKISHSIYRKKSEDLKKVRITIEEV